MSLLKRARETKEKWMEHEHIKIILYFIYVSAYTHIKYQVCGKNVFTLMSEEEGRSKKRHRRIGWWMKERITNERKHSYNTC